MKAPWDYSEPAIPGEPIVENLPTSEGRMLGEQLARLADIEEVRLRERFPRLQPRCDECALRLGTIPNGCVETLMDVIKCTVEGGSTTFYCHKGIRGGRQPKRMCAGFALLLGSDFSEALAERVSA